MKILVCGSRAWKDAARVAVTLHAFRMVRPTIIHGDAEGADRMADWVAREYDWPRHVFPVTQAQWAAHGRAAGPLRNARMLREGDPDIVIAFRCAGESRGTDDMIRQAREAGVPVWVIREEDV